jgi:plastocyanin
MRIDRLPIAEGLVGFLLVMLLVTFLLTRHYIGDPESEAAATGSPTASAGPTGSVSPGGLEITMTDNHFDKSELTAAANTDVTIQLTNNGAAIHNLHIASASGTFSAAFCTTNGPEPCSDPNRLAGGSTGTLTFNLPAGTYPYRCDFHTQEMKGTLTVQ